MAAEHPGVMRSSSATALAVSRPAAGPRGELTTDELYCWGTNFAGELGLEQVLWTPKPLPVPIDITIEELGLGSALTCARLVDGRVRCWGGGHEGQLANGTGADTGMVPVANVASIDFGEPLAALALAASNGHACARLGDGSMRCWGASGEGQTGRAQTANIGDNADEVPLSTPVFLFPP